MVSWKHRIEKPQGSQWDVLTFNLCNFFFMECTKFAHEYLVLEQESRTKHRTSHVGV